MVFFYARLALKEGMIMKVLYKLLHTIAYIIAKLIIEGQGGERAQLVPKGL